MKIYIVGVGMGTAETLTPQASQAIEKSSVLIGSKRMLMPYKNKKNFEEYKPQAICEILKTLDKNCCVAILLSGDTGFHSGAKGILKAVENLAGIDVEVIAGISTVSYFCSRLKISWQDMFIVSLHGENCNIIQHISRNKYVFALLSKGGDVAEICNKLCYYDMADIRVSVGTNLSYPNEKIVTFNAGDFKSCSFDKLAAVIFENTKPHIYKWLADDDFIRAEKIPMTKFAVRCQSLAMLNLSSDSIVYDVGAGTGSVSIEMALTAINGKVYAIEKNEAAIQAITKNKKRFAADNIEIVTGTAPAALNTLEAPTHAFIGGSGGNIAEIIDCIFAKNSQAVIVANAITLDTLCQLKSYISENKLLSDIVQLSASNARAVNGYHLMQAQNSVYIIKLRA